MVNRVRLLAFAVVFFLSGAVSAQVLIGQPGLQSVMPLTMESLGLVGPVSEVEENTLTVAEHMGREGFYLSSGRLIMIDIEGRVQRITNYDNFGVTKGWSLYTHVEWRPATRERYSASGSRIQADSYYYDAEHRLTLVVSRDSNGTSEYPFVFDAEGRLVEAGHTFRYEYAEDRLMYEYQNDQEVPSRRYRLDEQGRVIGSHMPISPATHPGLFYSGASIEDPHRISWVGMIAEYNVQGFTASLNNTGVITSYTYEFDEIGNWVFRRQFNGDGTLVGAVERIISYHPH